MDYTLENLDVYKQAESFSDKIWNMVQSFDYFTKDTIGKQVARSEDSISANIAEGYGRHYFKESKQFYFFARGSIQETKSWLGKCERRNLIYKVICTNLIEEANLILLKLNSYIKFISEVQKKNIK
ncbi:MAG: four helix bundle protein [Chitinophagaceae bacterium]|nr:four helix bundle protein [Chitinophagaceae bacterium]